MRDVRRRRLIVCLLALALAAPPAAWAQGAGDDQYQDPFGDEPTQGQARQGGQDDQGGLSDEPPLPGGDDGRDGGGSPETPAPDTPAPDTPAPRNALPNTGADPRPLAVVGVALLLLGLGLRLRTIDPDAY